MVSIGVIQNQRDRIFDIIRAQLLTPAASTHTCKYGVIALQFLLHSKTRQQWNLNADKQTIACVRMLLQMLVDTKRDKAQK